MNRECPWKNKTQIEKRKKKRKKKNFNFTFKKKIFSTSILETSSWLVFHDWFPLKFVFTNNISFMCWEIKKRRSKVQEKNMPYEHALNFDQWKTFSEHYKPMRVWLWRVYKFNENYCRSRLFSESIQTLYIWQSTYPNLKTIRHSKLKFSLWTKFIENLLHKNLLLLITKS